MKMNEIYEAPMLEVLNVMIETGFAGSVNDDNFDGQGGGNGDSADF